MLAEIGRGIANRLHVVRSRFQLTPRAVRKRRKVPSTTLPGGAARPEAATIESSALPRHGSRGGRGCAPAGSCEWRPVPRAPRRPIRTCCTGHGYPARLARCNSRRTIAFPLLPPACKNDSSIALQAGAMAVPSTHSEWVFLPKCVLPVTGKRGGNVGLIPRPDLARRGCALCSNTLKREPVNSAHSGHFYALRSAGFSRRGLVLARSNPRRPRPAPLKPTALSASSLNHLDRPSPSSTRNP